MRLQNEIKKNKENPPWNNSRSPLVVLLLLGFCFFSLPMIQAQQNNFNPSGFSIGAKMGYDAPLFPTPFKELKYKGGRYLGLTTDYRFPSQIGIRADYANILTQPDIQIADFVYDGKTSEATQKDFLNIKRKFVGLGPSYTLGNARANLVIAPMVGYTWMKGGDAMVTSLDSAKNLRTHLFNTGFHDQNISAKMDLEFNVALTSNLRLSLGAYYLRQFGVHFDAIQDLTNTGPHTIVHGEDVFVNTPQAYTLSGTSPMMLPYDKSLGNCMDFSSVGVNLGINYTFGSRPKVLPPKEADCIICECPNDAHKVVVTLRDQVSGKVIPNGDVALVNQQGSIIATGTTNTFGVVDFSEIRHGNYTVTGNVYGIETTTTSIYDQEFIPNAIIQKEILYTDLRFILKGNTINKGTRGAEPNVVVSLTNAQSGSVKQDNSDGRGAFAFRLDKDASYELVGSKENKLSDIERASTMGLTRSTTLFVDLELGMDDFDCGRGTVLDIKYAFNESYLTPASQFELDRLVRYLQDHRNAKIELSSHTDSRGSNAYNLKLSQQRAKSAVDYILSKGVAARRVTAQGYGETRPLNHCRDGVNCNEMEYEINRRTEAMLKCR